MSSAEQSSMTAVMSAKATRMRGVRYLRPDPNSMCAMAPATLKLMYMAPPSTGSMPRALENREAYIYWYRLLSDISTSMTRREEAT